MTQTTGKEETGKEKREEAMLPQLSWRCSGSGGSACGGWGRSSVLDPVEKEKTLAKVSASGGKTDIPTARRAAWRKILFFSLNRQWQTQGAHLPLPKVMTTMEQLQDTAGGTNCSGGTGGLGSDQITAITCLEAKWE